MHSKQYYKDSDGEPCDVEQDWAGSSASYSWVRPRHAKELVWTTFVQKKEEKRCLEVDVATCIVQVLSSSVVPLPLLTCIVASTVTHEATSSSPSSTVGLGSALHPTTSGTESAHHWVHPHHRASHHWVHPHHVWVHPPRSAWKSSHHTTAAAATNSSSSSSVPSSASTVAPVPSSRTVSARSSHRTRPDTTFARRLPVLLDLVRVEGS